MSNLTLVKSEIFGSVQCDFWQNENDDVFMTSEQLGRALGFAEPRKSISNLVNRHEYLKEPEFSGVTVLMTPGGKQESRVFTEDGIYEITFLAKTEKAREFRAWVRKILKALRKGDAIIIKPSTEQSSPAEIRQQELKIRAINAEARLRDATLRQAKFLLAELDKRKGVLSTQSVELLTINALEMIVGDNMLPRPRIDEKFYTATEIAKEAGVSANLIGKLANAYGLKTDEYGITVLDKSPYSDKQVSAFRYNERGRAKLLELVHNVERDEG